MWFLVVLITPHANPEISQAMAKLAYDTESACMFEAAYRVQYLARVNIHGRYICMYHNEPDGELVRRTPKGF